MPFTSGALDSFLNALEIGPKMQGELQQQRLFIGANETRTLNLSD